jgi:hypothetical protein
VRSGVALIELVFALVIIGFVMMSVPVVLTESAKSNIVAMQQEEIMLTKTKIALILSMQWDENAIVGERNATKSVQVGTGSPLLQCIDNGSSWQRRGHIVSETRRECFSDKSASAIGNDANDPINHLGNPIFDDMDDYHNATERVEPSGRAATGSEGDYIFSYDVQSSVQYISDNFNYAQQTLQVDFNTTAIVNPSNIKYIEVTTTRTVGGDIPIRLSAFSSNVGNHEARSIPIGP